MARKTKTPTARQLKATMAEHEAEYRAYEQARIKLRDTEGLSAKAQASLKRTMERNRSAYSAYWQAFCNPLLVTERAEQRAAKAAAK